MTACQFGVACFLQHLHWKKLDHFEGEPCPEGRSYHAAACLGYGGERPQLFVTGGMGDGGKVLSDAWMLDIKSNGWTKVGSCTNRC